MYTVPSASDRETIAAQGRHRRLIAAAGTSGDTGKVDVVHFLSLRDWGAARTLQTLDRADELARLWKLQRMPQALRGKRVALWFYGDGFRNRLAFELGAKELGASIAYVPGELGVHEPIEDVVGYLENWFEMLVLRAKRHEDLLGVAARSRIPVINARTDRSHPCEILGDLLYIRRRFVNLAGLRVVFVGEPSNLCMSWVEAAAVLPIGVIQVCPPGYEISEPILKGLQRNAAGEIRVTHELDAALVDADVIYTDCWPRAATAEERAGIRKDFLPYQIGERHLSALGEDGIFLPCPPVTRGEEVSSEAMLSPRCQNHAAKDNLLHVQNAIMEALVAG
ncbi:MAG: ornithine carbamoyltransferase [Deltaproteobacteria bacterium]